MHIGKAANENREAQRYEMTLRVPEDKENGWTFFKTFLGCRPDKSLEEENWKWQGVKANAQKLQEIMESWKADVLSCAERLEELKADDSLHATQAQQLPEDIEHEGSQFAKYGSKIEMIVKHVQKVQSEDPTAKIICFVQWEDLKRKISKALKEFQVAHATLHGGVWSRQRVLRRFQYESEGPRMLLLSLEESASGTNLTAANHVLIVHPMEAESKEEAVAFEMQAVGRVRRPGQAKKIFIWRFVTVDTVEQQITEEHQKELWERQAAATIQPRCQRMQQMQGQEPFLSRWKLLERRHRGRYCHAMLRHQHVQGH
eukprot:s610_g13.t1